MKKVFLAFMLFLKQIRHDFMLAICIAAPIIMGAAFRFLLPLLENILCSYFSMDVILTPYYILFDLLLAIMTAIMFCFAGVLVVLEELDDGIAKYLAVTPLGKRGYVLSRIGLPTVLATFYTVLVLGVFTVSGVSWRMMICFAIGGGLTGILTALLVIAFAKNKLEGMVYIKLCGLLIAGIPVAYFVKGPAQYLCAVLPSFWLAKLCITAQYVFLAPAVILSALFIFVFYKKFKTKLL